MTNLVKAIREHSSTHNEFYHTIPHDKIQKAIIDEYVEVWFNNRWQIIEFDMLNWLENTTHGNTKWPGSVYLNEDNCTNNASKLTVEKLLINLQPSQMDILKFCC